MLSQMINQKDIVVPHLGVAQERLRENKVFLVLDDVDQKAQLDALAKDVQWFGLRSRIIITTEDLRLLNAHGISHIYKVNFPSNDEALQMFSMYAFDQKTPKDGFAGLAYEITYFVGQLPLGLKVMGSHFRGFPKEEWSMEIEKLRANLDGGIESILKFSYDALCHEDKDLFLHIACCFSSDDMERVEAYLAESFKNVKQKLHVLADKSLLSIDDNRIKMDNLLVQLGKEIVRKQSIHEPGQRQFLVGDKDTCEVLTDYTAITRSVIGIQYFGKLNITENAFERMSNLQFLRVWHENIISSSGPLHYISPKLRLLNWSFASITSLPIIINLEYLVELRMESCNLEKLWDGIILLQKLKWMNLANSRNLKELPNLSTATSLKELDLSGCSRLVEIPSSIGNATNLKELDLHGCSSLVELPSSVGNATNLRKLDLDGYSSLVELPSSIGNATNLKKLDLHGCSSLVEIPSSIGNATNLEVLDLHGCSSLVELPFSIGNLHKLMFLCLKGCSKLKTLPININMKSLDSLDLTDCSSLKFFPEISRNIIYLKLIGTSIKEVPWSIRSWSHLRDLHMPYSENLKEFLYIHNNITNLHLSDTEIQELGPWVKGCSRLQILVLNGMKNLVSLPQLPDSLSFIDAENCESLEKLDWNFRIPRIGLNFVNYFKLNQEARDLIIQTSTLTYAVLPDGEVPACFTYRASGSSVTVKLNQKSLRTSTKFKACILFVNKGETGFHARAYISVSCCTSKQIALTKRTLHPIFTEHLYIFGFEAKELTSTKLVFKFDLKYYEISKNLEIKECGIFQLLEHHEIISYIIT